MPQSCKMANRIMQWLLTLALSPPSSQSLADRQTDRASPFLERGWLSGFRVFSVWTWVHLLAFRAPVGLERNRRGEGQTVVRFSGWWGREPGREAWQVAKAGKHTEPCLKPGRAPSTGAERGWVKGYKKKGGGEGRPIKKRRHADTYRRADCADHYKSCVCVGQKVACHCEVKGGKNSKQSYPI